MRGPWAWKKILSSLLTFSSVVFTGLSVVFLSSYYYGARHQGQCFTEWDLPTHLPVDLVHVFTSDYGTIEACTKFPKWIYEGISPFYPREVARWGLKRVRTSPVSLLDDGYEVFVIGNS